jgi:hypothetical protein
MGNIADFLGPLDNVQCLPKVFADHTQIKFKELQTVSKVYIFG